MSIEIICFCDGKNCRNRIDADEETYCHDCYQELLDRIAELEEQIVKMEEK